MLCTKRSLELLHLVPNKLSEQLRKRNWKSSKFELRRHSEILPFRSPFASPELSTTTSPLLVASSYPGSKSSASFSGLEEGSYVGGKGSSDCTAPEDAAASLPEKISTWNRSGTKRVWSYFYVVNGVMIEQIITYSSCILRTSVPQSESNFQVVWPPQITSFKRRFRLVRKSKMVP